MVAESIRVTGTVQGVGFRPTVWRLAGECGVTGRVRNDAAGVLIEAWGESSSLDRLVDRLRHEPPPLAVISDIQRVPLSADDPPPAAFDIVESIDGETSTDIAADAATCDACLDDISDPTGRRYRYPFTNCTHCGPRMTIVRTVPYDRANTSMASFSMCPECKTEYDDPADRRFHAQPNACPVCGPRTWLEDRDGRELPVRGVDAIEDAAGRLRAGEIVAIKGLGGFHLACLAENAEAVERLRRRKRRYQKALAMMARDVSVVGRYADMGDEAESLLRDRRAPIVVMAAKGRPLPEAIAPGQDTIGFMLPYTPLHHLLLESFDEPLVMTSGNQSDEPQVIDNDVARESLSGIADVFLMHNRDIVNRLDDSVVAVPGAQVLRRARGFAPEPIRLHDSFRSSPPVLAMGGELKNTFCLMSDGEAVVSQHIGDTEDAEALDDYLDMLELYGDLYDFTPSVIAIDRHPDYLPSKVGREMAHSAELIDVQHHHAHVASCLAEHGRPIDQAPVLGVVLDGLGLGDDGTIWGGEFLLADFVDSKRLARFQPVPLPGGSLAMREPWRNTWAHLDAAFGWSLASKRYRALGLVHRLAEKPVSNLAAMHRQNINSPLASSAGRLFDAVAAACGLCFDDMTHEAQAAMELETLAARALGSTSVQPYPVDVSDGDLPTLSWQSLWRHLLDDLSCGVPVEQIAARFHLGVADALACVAAKLASEHGVDTIVLSGGVFQNLVLLDAVTQRLGGRELHVLVPERLPANDGGLSLGQAVVAAARLRSRP